MLLSRVAESMMWLGRYVERAENTARLLEVTYHGKLDTASDDLPGATNTWEALIATVGATERYVAAHNTYDEGSVVEFLALDARDPASIISSVAAARENARSVRNLISSETWMAINRLYHTVANTNVHLIALDGLYEFCDTVRTGANLCAGAIRETSLHDEGMQWLWAGAALERADMVTRIVDSKYHVLLRRVEDVGGPLDRYHWAALLRSVSGWEAYHQQHPLGPDPTAVVEFLLLNRQFPRSLRSSVDELLRSLDAATTGADPRLRNEPMHLVTDLQNQLRFTTAEQLIASGLHEFLTRVQRELAKITAAVQHSFFWASAGAA